MLCIANLNVNRNNPILDLHNEDSPDAIAAVGLPNAKHNNRRRADIRDMLHPGDNNPSDKYPFGRDAKEVQVRAFLEHNFEPYTFFYLVVPGSIVDHAEELFVSFSRCFWLVVVGEGQIIGAPPTSKHWTMRSSPSQSSALCPEG